MGEEVGVGKRPQTGTIVGHCVGHAGYVLDDGVVPVAALMEGV